MAFTATPDRRPNGQNQEPHNPLGTFRSSVDVELKNHNAAVARKSQDFERFDRKKRPSQNDGFFSSIARMFKPTQRQSERRLIDRMLKEWDHDRSSSAKSPSILKQYEDPKTAQHTAPLHQQQNPQTRTHTDASSKVQDGSKRYVSDPAHDSFRERAERRAQEYAQAMRNRGVSTKAADFRQNETAPERKQSPMGPGIGFTNPFQLPVAIAVFFLLCAMLSTVFVPGTFVTGLLASKGIVVPLGRDSDNLLFEFSSPAEADKPAGDTGNVDTRNFEALKLEDYVVQTGDTLSAIATKFHLNIDSILSVNNISDPKRIRVGSAYKIPNRDGLYYKVVRGDSLQSIADKYKVSLTSMLDANGMTDETVETGSQIFVPGARMNSTDLKMLLGELFLWPGPQVLSARFGYEPDPFTGLRHFHNGIDMPAYIGYPVRAALAGRVVLIQNQVGNYGKVIMIQHDRGIKTLYGHLDSYNVDVGQYVQQGQLIAKMGNTGRSTGPHLHFSVFLNGVAVNPLRYLK